MKLRQITKAVFVVLCLLCIALVASPAKRKVRIRSRYYNIPQDSVRKDSLHVKHIDTLTVFSDQTVSSRMDVYSSSTLRIDSTTVAERGNLRATAEDSITVSCETEVVPGGELLLSGASQYAISYTYNAAGYRTLRKLTGNAQ